MDDRETVAAIVAGDLSALAAAYDEHAESLYGYCRWMLGVPEDAADAVENTFVIAAGRLDRLREPRRLRPWLYAVARNECHSRLRASEVGLGEDTGPADPPTDTGTGVRGQAERAELARLVRTALDELSPGEREVIELDLRHDLQGADLAAVLGVPRNQAHTLASHARGELEAALAPLFVARTGRRGCAELDLLLDGWDGQLTGSTHKLVGRHIEECDACADRSHGALRAAVRYGMAPLAPLPPELRDEVLELCTDSSPETLAYRREVTQRAGTFLPTGFPQAIRAPRRRMIALSGTAAVVGVLVALMATGVVTVLALTGSHSPRPAAAGTGASSGSASTSATGDTGVPSGASPAESPVASAPPSSSVPPPAAPASVSPTRVKPSRSHQRASAPPDSPTPRLTVRPPTSSATASASATGTTPPTDTAAPPGQPSG
jgi:RNA polymerase sigma factor (sigma-70 family)